MGGVRNSHSSLTPGRRVMSRSSSRRGRTTLPRFLDGVRRAVEEGLDLPPPHARESVQELLARSALLQVVDERVDRDAGTGEHQVAAVHVRVPGDDRLGRRLTGSVARRTVPPLRGLQDAHRLGDDSVFKLRGKAAGDDRVRFPIESVDSLCSRGGRSRRSEPPPATSRWCRRRDSPPAHTPDTETAPPSGSRAASPAARARDRTGPKEISRTCQGGVRPGA